MVETTPIDQNFWKVIQWQLLISLFVLLLLIAAFFLLPERGVLQPVVALVSLSCWGGVFVLQKKAFHRRSYAVRENDLLYKRGILAIVTTVVPFNRIQHVAVHEGVFSRKWKLASLYIYTAGGSSADIKIAGLPREEAFRIKELIVAKIEQ